MIRFFSFVFLCTLMACNNGLPDPLPDGGQGGSSAESSASSTSSGSSGGPLPLPCEGSVVQLAPLDGEDGTSYYEDGVHACRRFGAGKYSRAQLAWRVEWPCQTAPEATWAVAPWGTTTGFTFAPLVTLPPSGEMALDTVVVGQGDGLFVCAVLSVYSPDNRSCVDGCSSVGDFDSFWGDTGPDGTVIVPTQLEGLSVSPTAAEAVLWGNDKIRLMIEAND